MIPGMRRFPAPPLVFLALVSAGCRALPGDTPEGATPVWGDLSDGIRISLAMRDDRLRTGDPVEIRLLVENTAPGTASLQTIPAFSIDHSAYWCPVDIVREGSPLPANGRVNLSLDPHAAASFQFDVSELKCGPGHSSIWPDADLPSILTPGEHSLRLEIEIAGGKQAAWIRSNEIVFDWAG
jgi:hypothetical protein